MVSAIGVMVMLLMAVVRPLLLGSNFSDSISGNTSHDKLIGNAGNDTFIGNGGNDTIFAGTGDDVIKLATGELVDGIELSGSSGTDKLLLTLGGAAYTGTLDLDDISNIETIETSGTAGTGDVELTFAAVTTNTTTETITIDGSQSVAPVSCLITNSAATDKKLFNITGGAGADS